MLPLPRTENPTSLPRISPLIKLSYLFFLSMPLIDCNVVLPLENLLLQPGRAGDETQRWLEGSPCCTGRGWGTHGDPPRPVASSVSPSTSSEEEEEEAGTAGRDGK